MKTFHLSKVEPRGVEPRVSACKAGSLPLTDGPIVLLSGLVECAVSIPKKATDFRTLPNQRGSPGNRTLLCRASTDRIYRFYLRAIVFLLTLLNYLSTTSRNLSSANCERLRRDLDCPRLPLRQTLIL